MTPEPPSDNNSFFDPRRQRAKEIESDIAKCEEILNGLRVALAGLRGEIPVSQKYAKMRVGTAVRKYLEATPGVWRTYNEIEDEMVRHNVLARKRTGTLSRTITPMCKVKTLKCKKDSQRGDVYGLPDWK